VTDVEGGDGEVIMLPPDRSERRFLAQYTQSPNLDEHFKTALFLFTGDEYQALIAQIPDNPANKRTPEVGPLMEIEACTWVVPANPPPPNALALTRMLVMRNMRATPGLVGGMIGMP